MEFVANALNKKFLKYLLPPSGSEIDGVMAAIAYASNFPNAKEDFIADCVNNRYRLDLWVRYDHTVPVAPSLLRRILKHHKDNIFCKLIPDCLHSKVIWWKGYGAYIGSANLTDRAWNSNIEAGLFLTEDDLHSNGILDELEKFFESLKNISESFPLTDEVIKELELIAASRLGIEDKGKNLRTTPIWQGPLFEASLYCTSYPLAPVDTHLKTALFSPVSPFTSRGVAQGAILLQPDVLKWRESP